MSEPVFEHHGEGSEAPSVDSAPISQQEPGGQPATESPESGETNYPQAWSPILEKLPKEFHGAVAPELKKWDQGVNTRFQKIHDEYAPVKPLLEQGMTPQQLQAAAGIYQSLNADPSGFLENLRDHLISTGQYADAQQVQNQIDAEEDDDDEDEDNPILRELQELRQWRDEFTGSLEQQMQAQQEAALNEQAAVEVKQEFADLESKYGTLSPELKRAVGEKVLSLQAQFKKPVPLEAAYGEVMKLINAASQAPSSPRIVPGGGGMPQPQAPDLTDEDTRRKAAENLVLRMQTE